MRKKYIIGSMVLVATAAAVVTISANGISANTTSDIKATYEEASEESEAKLSVSEKNAVAAAKSSTSKSEEKSEKDTLKEYFKNKAIVDTNKVKKSVKVYESVAEKAEDEVATGTIDVDTVITVNQKDGKWTRVQAGSIKGWVKTEELIFGDKAAEKVGTNVKFTVAVQENVKAYKAADLESEVVASLKKDKSYDVKEKTEDWIKVKVEKEDAYVRTKNVMTKWTSEEAEKASKEAAEKEKASKAEKASKDAAEKSKAAEESWLAESEAAVKASKAAEESWLAESSAAAKASKEAEESWLAAEAARQAAEAEAAAKASKEAEESWLAAEAARQAEAKAAAEEASRQAAAKAAAEEASRQAAAQAAAEEASRQAAAKAAAEEASRQAAAQAAAEEAARQAAAQAAAEEAARQAAAKAAAEEAARQAAAQAAAEEASRQAAAQAAAQQQQQQQAAAQQHLGKFRITHYCSCAICCGQWSNGTGTVIGASGMVLTPGQSIAVNPAQIPYGSRVMINGQVYIAADTGVGSNCIDIYTGTNHAVASAGGMYYADVYLLK